MNKNTFFDDRKEVMFESPVGSNVYEEIRSYVRSEDEKLVVEIHVS